LEPKYYDINFDFERVNGRINTEIEEKQLKKAQSKKIVEKSEKIMDYLSS